MSKKTVIEYPAEANPEDSDVLYLIKGLTDRKIILRKLKDYILGSVNRLVKDTPETDSGTVLTANGVNNLIARVGKLYIQYPFMPTPDHFYGVGNWLDISTRAVGYGISDVNNGDPTSYISREAAGQGMDFADTDLAVDDQIGGGTYDGKYIRSVETYEGDFFRAVGGNAKVFNDERQPTTLIDHYHKWVNGAGASPMDSGTGMYGYQPGDTAAFAGAGDPYHSEINPNGAVSEIVVGVENTPPNRSIVFWMRTV